MSGPTEAREGRSSPIERREGRRVGGGGVREGATLNALASPHGPHVLGLRFFLTRQFGLRLLGTRQLTQEHVSLRNASAHSGGVNSCGGAACSCPTD